MEYSYSPMQLAEITDFSFLKASDTIRIMPTIDPERLLQAAEEQMLGDGNAGFCTACGEERDGCEPDARRYPCEACGANKVYGASELIQMGWVPGL